MPEEPVDDRLPAGPLSAEKLRRAFEQLVPGQLPDALRLLRDTRELLEETNIVSAKNILFMKFSHRKLKELSKNNLIVNKYIKKHCRFLIC